MADGEISLKIVVDTAEAEQKLTRILDLYKQIDVLAKSVPALQITKPETDETVEGV